MKIIKGDLLKIEKGIICHQVNCLRVAGSGIANQIANKWPEWYKDFVKTEPRLGLVSLFHINKDLIIASLYTQYDYGYEKRYTNYAAMGKALMFMSSLNNVFGIYFPYFIGCGLGGGNWLIVKQI